MKKIVFGMALFSIMLVLGLGLTGCGDSDGGPTGNSGEQTGGTGSADGKVTITLLAGSGTGNIRLKLSAGAWNTGGSCTGPGPMP
jgi:ABC-type glycerol-3-phosphate transport system substrate-binding protein